MIQDQISKVLRPPNYQRNVDNSSLATDNTENDDLIDVTQMAETLFTLPDTKS